MEGSCEVVEACRGCTQEISGSGENSTEEGTKGENYCREKEEGRNQGTTSKAERVDRILVYDSRGTT